MTRRGWQIAAALGLVVVIAALSIHCTTPERADPRRPLSRVEQARQLLFDEIQPVTLANCELQRLGERHDGGYLLCGNLLGEVKSGYSYGISGYDAWGCDVSRTLGVPVHQYDCFDLTRPVCEEGRTIFHEECIGSVAGLQEDRLFDTLAAQIAKNGDLGKHLVVKMDVEGAEWDALLNAPEGILQRIDQLAIEFHGFEGPFILAIQKLKQFFHVAHLHWNNFSCGDGQAPFPAHAYEMLFVSKRIGVPAASGKAALPHRLDAPNNPEAPDCQGRGTSPVERVSYGTLFR